MKCSILEDREGRWRTPEYPKIEKGSVRERNNDLFDFVVSVISCYIFDKLFSIPKKLL